MERPSGRRPDQLRPVRFTRGYTRHAEGSVLVEYGDTKVICTASVDRGVPRFMRGEGRGRLTAEHGMLPRWPNTRMDREAARAGIIHVAIRPLCHGIPSVEEWGGGSLPYRELSAPPAGRRPSSLARRANSSILRVSARRPPSTWACSSAPPN